TRRSGPAARGRSALPSARGRGVLDDLRDQLVQVAVGLEDHLLAQRAVAGAQQVLDALQLLGAAERLGVRAQLLEQRRRHLPNRAPGAAAMVEQLRLDAMARRQPAVLVDHLPGLVDRL